MAKTGNKFERFKAQEVVTKDKYKVGGSVTRGYVVLELDGGEIVFKSPNMWDAIDHCRELNTK